MTTIDYKEKYEAALERCKKLYNEAKANEYTSDIEDYETIFPELKESEDEEMKEAIIGTIHLYYGEPLEDEAKEMIAWLEKQGKSSEQIHYWTEEEIEPIISDYLRGAEHYGGMIGRLRCLKPKSLEKQGEQKPAEWSEEDERLFNSTIGHLRYSVNNGDFVLPAGQLEDWLKSLKDRVQPKQEWCEEDKKKLNRIYTLLAEAADKHAFSTTCRLIGDKECVELQDFLRSLRPQPKQEWSEEDEDNYKRILEILQDCHAYGRYDLRMDEHAALKNWLKSLKGRVQPQTKQEWSEEDERERKRVVCLLEGWLSTFKETSYAEDCNRGINWLKSLRPYKQ